MLREPGQPGYGLGLAITAETATLFGATLDPAVGPGDRGLVASLQLQRMP